MLRSIFMAIEIIMLIVFSVPLFSGILNPGNAAGLIICIVSGLITIYFDKFSHFVGHIFRSTGGKVFVIASASVLCAITVYVSVLSGFMAAAQKKPPEDTKAVIVLGCKVNGTSPSRMLSRRLDAAYDYLYLHPETICIVSGGKGTDEKIPEAKVMQSYLLEKGIDEKRIIVEDKSKNTAENLENSARILREMGIDSAAIATDGFHQYRASLLAEHAGIDVSGAVNAKSDFMTKWLIPTYWVREWMAITKEYLT